MSRNIVIYDDFYKDPDKIRSTVLRSGFTFLPGGTYPGSMSEPIICPDAQRVFSSVIGKHVVPKENSWYGQFRISLASDPFEQWIHMDPAAWSVIVYLNPEGTYPEENGTAFWRHRETGWTSYPGDWRNIREVSQQMMESGYTGYDDIRQRIIYQDGLDLTKWKQELFVPGRYNRAIFFRPHYWHSHMPKNNFGTSPESGRLVQLFFLEEVYGKFNKY